jgi:RHS repeat-associated protein
MNLQDSVTGNWGFNYDTLNRLIWANASSGPNSNQYGCWGYDSFGNRTHEVFSTTSISSTTPCDNTVSGDVQNTIVSYTSSATNRVDQFQYDYAGNVLNDGQNQYGYDGEGRLCAVFTSMAGMSGYTQYIYDAESRRVAKGTANNLSCAPPGSGFTPTNQYLLGLNGEQVTELGGAGSIVPQHTNAWAGGALLATYDFVNGGMHFILTDPLGTKRVQFNGQGVAELNCFSLPFGNDINNTRVPDCMSTGGGAVDATENHFTGKERDTESGNDYFGARYYSSNMGRFLTPDWAAKPITVPYASFGDPQTLNLFTYVENGPLNRVDADGHAPAMMGLDQIISASNGLLGDGSCGFSACPPSEEEEAGDVANLVEAAYEAQVQQTSAATGNTMAQPAQAQNAAQQQSTSSTPSQPSDVVTGAAADKQRGLVLDQLSGMLPGTSTDDLNKQLGTDCHAHGGNCDFTMDPSLTVALNTAAGVKNDKDHPNNIADFGGSTYGPHSRFGLSPSLHHNHGEVHVDHFNGGSILGFLPHVIVDVAIGEAFYGSHKVFSY